ncbi:MAG: hypothetical protein RL456_777 [Pseudomonadota bacterium]|jgi:nucleotide-binding universal stress UspA family protein
MFHHILLPTDGSALSETAVRHGLDLARASGARVTGLHVMPDYHVLTYRVESIEDTREEFARDCREHAARHLARISHAADEMQVPARTLAEVSDHPWETICRVAERDGCDLIVMASHGRRGMTGLLLGSETQRVLTHTKIPVMVWR